MPTSDDQLKDLSESLRIDIGSLSDEARSRAREFEEQRDLSRDYFDRLRSSGLFRVLVPTAQGGLGGSLVEWFRLVTTLAEADGSAGWVAAHGAMTSAIISAAASEAFARIFFGEGNATAAWSNLSRSEVREVPGGLMISARWGFVTGCSYAEYLGGMVKIPLSGDEPRTRVVSALVPRSEATIEPTWDPVGLAGTGSHDVKIEETFVPWDRLLPWPRPWRPESNDASRAEPRANPCAVLATGTWPISLCCAATQLGIARHALHAIRRDLDDKRDGFTGKRVIERPGLVSGLEEAEGLWLVCHTAFESLLRRVWHLARSGAHIDQDVRTDIRLACVTSVQQCRTVVRAAFDAAGSSGLRRAGVMQQLYRDSSCLTSHVSVSKGSFEVIGRTRYGIDTPGWL